jgi:hypothetical protein
MATRSDALSSRGKYFVWRVRGERVAIRMPE